MLTTKMWPEIEDGLENHMKAKWSKLDQIVQILQILEKHGIGWFMATYGPMQLAETDLGQFLLAAHGGCRIRPWPVLADSSPVCDFPLKCGPIPWENKLCVE